MKTIGILIGVVMLSLAGTIGFLLPKGEQNVGSVMPSGEYKSTTTTSVMKDPVVLKEEGGALGSIIVTNAMPNWSFDLYDATTTNINLRTNRLATSSIYLASFPATTATGTYVFDASFYNGLTLSKKGGTAGTATITWR